MKKSVFIALAIIISLMTISVNSYADRGRHGGHGGHFGIGLSVGPLWGWGPYYSSPYYPYYPYYAAPPVVQFPQQEVYVQPAPQQQEETGYWYYCRNPEGYYPYVKKCPGGWMKVVPTPPPADEEE